MSMLTAEQRAFLMEQVRTAKLATVRKDGRPHVVPVWFDLDGIRSSSLPGRHRSRRRPSGATHGSVSVWTMRCSPLPSS